jgi:ubiquinol-cytochrome c reductase cytochrome b subunit
MRPFGHVFGVLVVVGLLAGVAGLTYLALAEDRADTPKAEKYRERVEEADVLAHRAINLAYDEKGIPATGAIDLLRRDPLTQGPVLFKAHCATCHAYGDRFRDQTPTASDLEGFGTEEWVRGLLRTPDSPQYFGRTKLKRMANWVKGEVRKTKNDKKKLDKLNHDFDVIAKWLASHPRTGPRPNDPQESHEGYRAFKAKCMECHKFAGQGGESPPPGPDLTGYGDEEWVRLMVMTPCAPSRYGARNAMPAFLPDDGPTAPFMRDSFERIKDDLRRAVSDDDPKADEKRKAIDKAQTQTGLKDVERELIIRWLLGSGRLVFGGDPIAPAPKR